MKRTMIFLGLGMFLILAVTALGLVPSVAEGAVPQLINFQGVLKDGSGNPVPDGSYSVAFTIYDAAAGGNVFWTETQSVTTSNGLFTVLLGSTTPLPDSVFYDSSRYLGMAVSPDAEMTPRQRLSSVGYSYVSSQWTLAGQNLFTLSEKVGIGESNPLNTLTIGSNGGFTSTGLFPGILMGTTSFQTKQLIIGRDEANFVQLAYADEDPDTYARLLVEGNHPLYITTGGSMVLATQTDNPLELYTNSTARVHITGDGNVGIGTTSPAYPLHVQNSSANVFAASIENQNPTGWGLEIRTAGTNAPQNALEIYTGGTSRFLVRNDGNVGIGTTSVGASNLLELSSTTKGFVLSRMTKAERNAIVAPVAGMMVYQTDNTPGLRVYNGTNWMRFTETAD